MSANEMRKSWENNFINAGLDVREMYTMSEDQFNSTCQFLIDSGFPRPVGEQAKNKDRKEWENAFREIGVSPNEMYSMPESDFLSSCQFIVDSGIYSPGTSNDSDLAKAISASMDDLSNNANNNSNEKLPVPTSEDEELARELQEQEYQGISNPINPPEQNDNPAPPPPPSYNNYMPSRTVSGQIRNEQNEEFIRAEFEMRQREEANRRKQEENERRAREEAVAQKSRIEKNKSELKTALQNLGPEPANGVTICIVFPSGNRIMRKFDKTHLCDELFTFVSGQDELFDDDDGPIPYTLMQPGVPIERGKTFEEVGITRRSMVNVDFD
ncbi:hypothetical protein TRFO_19931 [Tritrichomonas foetus]|uniref:UBX domain-containing protein n=1 Tax=Tritrichomonas foetus TaxID=1144522 RepID=A0A1J4KID9_9EUKA|nr:hypothetical protein TRFO_19931 [Tritrichomonas foetus]|eukprot:OHT10712.1 hypothetical protein TRFO_19931 [Tritrichomonas foetus]